MTAITNSESPTRNNLVEASSAYASAKAAFEGADACCIGHAKEALRAAHSAFFDAFQQFARGTGHGEQLNAFGSTATVAASYLKQAAYMTTLGGADAVPPQIRAVIRAHLEKWAAAEKVVSDLGYRTISAEDLQASVEIGGVVSKIAPTPVFDKIGIAREAGEEPVFHAAAALAAWDASEAKRNG
jgi:hypothetical protein